MLLLAGLSLCLNISFAEGHPWWDEKWESRAAIDIEKSIPGKLPGYPVIVPVGFLGLPEGTNWRSVRVVTPAGKELPFQVDDLDGDGKVARQDELVFLIDLDAATTRVYVYFSRGSPTGRSAAFPVREMPVSFDDEGNLRFDNGKLRLSETAAAKRVFACRLAASGKWVEILKGDGAMAFCAYNYSGSTVAGWRTNIVARGPVRTIARRVSSRVLPTKLAEETGNPVVPAQVVHEWHLYPDRRECFVSSQIQNLTTDNKTLAVARGTTTFEVTPGGKYTPEDFWTCVAASWKTWTASMAGGRKTQPAAAGQVNGIRPAEGWVDAYTDGPPGKPRANVGLAFHPRSEKCRLTVGERYKRFQLIVRLDRNWPKVAPRGRLWVGYWLCPHEGDSSEVRDFWLSRKSVDAIPGAIETWE